MVNKKTNKLYIDTLIVKWKENYFLTYLLLEEELAYYYFCE